MDVAVRHAARPIRTGARAAHRCPHCRVEALVLYRRHESSPSWGAPLVTEYYDCQFCDAQYQYSPATDRWKPIA